MAEENKQNSPQEILMIPIAILVVCIIVAIFLGWNNLIPSLNGYINAKNQYKSLIVEQGNKEKELENLKTANAPKANNNAPTGISKEFFKPLETGTDTESVIASEFNEILSLMTANTIKTRSVKYFYNPEGNSFVDNAGDKYSVCRLEMSMIATYSNFKNFMKELYKHEHYLEITKVEIVPYQKNKTILLVELQITLYAEKA